jgi:hypothetical protein
MGTTCKIDWAIVRAKDNYITRDWFLDSVGKTCNACKCEFIYIIHANSWVAANITADRINNNISHSLDNCKICCVMCNAST